MSPNVLFYKGHKEWQKVPPYPPVKIQIPPIWIKFKPYVLDTK